jgi:hypothetical protein
MSELAKDNPTAFDPNKVIFVVGKREDIKKTMNWYADNL